MQGIKQLISQHKAEFSGVILCLLIGMASGLATSQSDFSWYAALHKPSFNPPSYVFGPVWTVLYCLIGWSLGRVYKLRQQQKPLWIWFIVQLSFNAMWSFIFFQFHKIGWAMLDILALWLSLTVLQVLLYRRDTLSFWLLSPYWLWVSFASMLNISLYLLNA